MGSSTLRSTVSCGLIALGTVLGASAQAAPSLCDDIAGNLVTNCGFETGDFTGWTTVPAAQGTSMGVDGFLPNSGDFGAFFGAFIPPFLDSFYQTIPLITGGTYVLSFWLGNEGGPANSFEVSFGPVDNVFFDAQPFSYTLNTVTFVATSNSAKLTFTGSQVPEFFDIDDVSVVAVAEPGSLVLLGLGLAGLGFGRGKKACVRH
jgi:hypothetical protein